MCLDTSCLYNTVQYANENTIEYLVRFRNAQNYTEACNRSLITRGVQDPRMKIIFPLKNTGFDFIQENEKKEAETAGEEILCAILYPENSDKSRFSDLNKHVKFYFVLNKSE